MTEHLNLDQSHPGASHLAITVDQRVAQIELRRPEVLNALHSDTHRALQAALDLVEEREDVGAVILAGSGRSFCTGSDLREVGALRGADSRRYVELDFATKNRVEASPLPIVAAIQGWCVGGGVELALACDIRVAASDATFSIREVPLGSLPGSGGLQRLPHVVGLGVAKDWILRGVDVPAEEAYRRGLVTELARPDDLHEVARRIAETLASKSATALRLAKVAMTPEPIANHGLVAAFQALAVSACHDDPSYHDRTARYTAKPSR